MAMSRYQTSAAAGGGIAGALALLCTTMLGNFEGTKLHAYRDSVGIATACTGETKGIRMGMTFTKAQCKAMLDKRLAKDFAPALERCVTKPMSDKVYASFLSLEYNIGAGAFCRSSVVRLYNQGDGKGACNALMLYDRAGGRVLRGLEHRRGVERAYCLAGL